MSEILENSIPVQDAESKKPSRARRAYAIAGVTIMSGIGGGLAGAWLGDGAGLEWWIGDSQASTLRKDAVQLASCAATLRDGDPSLYDTCPDTYLPDIKDRSTITAEELGDAAATRTKEAQGVQDRARDFAVLGGVAASLLASVAMLGRDGIKYHPLNEG